MKQLVLVFVILTIFITGAAQKNVSDREFDGFVGPVKSFVDAKNFLSEARETNSNEKCLLCSEAFYDVNGNLTQTIFPGLNYKCASKIIDGFQTTKCSEIVEKPKYNGFNSSPISPENLTFSERVSRLECERGLTTIGALVQTRVTDMPYQFINIFCVAT